MAYKKIEDNDLLGKGVINLADTPGLSTQQMQEKFEETARSVIIPHFNQLIDALLENGVPVKSEDVIAIKKDSSGDLLISNDGVNWVHSSGNALSEKANKADTYTKNETDHKLLLKADNANVYSKKEIYTKAETEDAINKRISDIGSSDMTKAIYDKNNNGIIDNAEKLGGKSPEYFATKKDIEVEFVGLVNENLDNYKSKGIYFFDLSHKPVNPPTGNTQGWLVVIPNRATDSSLSVKQFWISGENHRIYSRVYISSINSWDDWAKILTETDKNELMPKNGGTFTGNVFFSGYARNENDLAKTWGFKNISVNNADWSDIENTKIRRIAMLKK